MKTLTKVLLFVAIFCIFLGVTASALYMMWGGFFPPTVKVIPVRGTISVFGEASSQRIVSQIRSADSDSSVKAIILEINSPGGYVVATEEISRAVEACDKPVVAWIREQGASGAYWIASSADLIVAERAAVTGSIGVSSSYLQFEGLMNKYGITYERLVTGDYKDIGSPYKELSDGERAVLQSKIDRINSMFIGHVARTRGMDEMEVRSLATGEIFIGVEALENGLIDEIGGKQDAFNAAKELSGAKNAELVEASSGSFLEDFLSIGAFWFGKGFADGLVKLAKPINQFTA